MDKLCKECGITSNKKYRKYCYEKQERECIICQNKFLFECNIAKKQTCSITCGNKLGKINAKSKNTLNCSICETIFQGQSINSKYCNRVVEVKCKGCNIAFKRKCNNDYGSYCSTSCRNSFMRKNTYKIKTTKICINCGDSFSPTGSSQLFCTKKHYRNCNYCNNEFIVQNNLNKFNTAKYCGNSCSTFSQMESKLNKDLIEEYQNINIWAINFKKENKRKPKLADFVIYFNLRRIPSYADKSLFERKRDSKLELIVLYYLKELGITTDTSTIRHYRERINGRWREVDLYFPEYKIGLEIQDFATHCKEQSDEISKFNNPMKDIRYHEEKRALFKSIGITVHDLWEDEIINDSFKGKIRKILKYEG